MRWSLALTAGILLVGLPAGCASGIPEPGEQTIEDFSPTDKLEIVKEYGKLPFRHIEWDFKLNNTKVRRATLGSRHIWVETHDNWLIALGRFDGFVKWKYWIPLDAPLDWAPVETQGVGEEITRAEKQLVLAQRAVELHSKQRPIIDEEEHFRKLNELKEKRREAHEQLAAAYTNDFLYLVVRGWLFCLERSTGRALWNTKLPLTPATRPFATRKHIYIASSDFSRVYWLSVEEKGKVIFSSSNDLGRHNQIFNRPVYEYPILYYASRDGVLRAWLVPKAREHWRFEIKDPWHASPYIHKLTRKELRYRINDEGAKKPVPVEMSYKLCVIGGLDRMVYALDADGGNIVWKYPAPARIKDAADGFRNGELVFVRTENGYLHAFEAVPQHKDRNGVAWAIVQNPRGPRWSIPKAERILLKTSRWIYVMGENHTVLRVDPRSGEITGRYRLNRLKWVFTNRMDDILYVGTEDGHFVALREERPEKIFTPEARREIEENRKKEDESD